MAEELDLGPVPEVFDPAKSYRIRISETIEMTGHKLIRAATHVVMGEFAEQHRDKILAAREEAM